MSKKGSSRTNKNFLHTDDYHSVIAPYGTSSFRSFVAKQVVAIAGSSFEAISLIPVDEPLHAFLVLLDRFKAGSNYFNLISSVMKDDREEQLKVLRAFFDLEIDINTNLFSTSRAPPFDPADESPCDSYEKRAALVRFVADVVSVAVVVSENKYSHNQFVFVQKVYTLAVYAFLAHKFLENKEYFTKFNFFPLGTKTVCIGYAFTIDDINKLGIPRPYTGLVTNRLANYIINYNAHLNKLEEDKYRGFENNSGAYVASILRDHFLLGVEDTLEKYDRGRKYRLVKGLYTDKNFYIVFPAESLLTGTVQVKLATGEVLPAHLSALALGVIYAVKFVNGNISAKGIIEEKEPSNEDNKGEVASDLDRAIDSAVKKLPSNIEDATKKLKELREIIKSKRLEEEARDKKEERCINIMDVAKSYDTCLEADKNVTITDKNGDKENMAIKVNDSKIEAAKEEAKVVMQRAALHVAAHKLINNVVPKLNDKILEKLNPESRMVAAPIVSSPEFVGAEVFLLSMLLVSIPDDKLPKGITPAMLAAFRQEVQVHVAAGAAGSLLDFVYDFITAEIMSVMAPVTDSLKALESSKERASDSLYNDAKQTA